LRRSHFFNSLAGRKLAMFNRFGWTAGMAGGAAEQGWRDGVDERVTADVGRDFYDRAPPILKFGNLAISEATRRASSFVSKFADVRRPGSSS
jgi:hypothetical protein